MKNSLIVLLCFCTKSQNVSLLKISQTSLRLAAETQQEFRRTSMLESAYFFIPRQSFPFNYSDFRSIFQFPSLLRNECTYKLESKGKDFFKNGLSPTTSF